MGRLTFMHLATLGALTLGLLGPAPASAASAWLPATNLSKPGHSSERAQIAMNAAGEAVAVWEYFNGKNWVVQSAARPPGGTWSAPTTISPLKGDVANETQIAINPAGEAVAVWQNYRFRSDRTAIETASRSSGGTWSAPTTISSSKGTNEADPQIAIAASGEAVAVWNDHPFLETASRSPAGTWSASTKLAKRQGGIGFPEVAINPAGEAVAIWESYDSTGNNPIVKSAAREPGGAWSTPVGLSKVRQKAGSPHIAISGSGEAVVVWISEGLGTVQAVSRPAGGRWSAAQNLSRIPRRPGNLHGNRAEEAQIGLNEAGEAVAVWAWGDFLHGVIQSASRSPGGEWSKPATVSAKSDDGFEPRVAVDRAGGAVLIWVTFDPRHNFLQGASRQPGGNWSKPTRLPEKEGRLLFPQLVGSSSGEAVAIWEGGREEHWIIHGTALPAGAP
jgi:hypothetical protein